MQINALSEGFKVECFPKNKPSCWTFKAPLVTLIIQAEKEGIVRIRFANKPVPSHGSYDFKPLERALTRYFSGMKEDFSAIPLLYAGDCFAGKVLTALRKVTAGHTVTYGELARSAGFPGAARAVGTVMANNPLPLIIPCHRVVPATGGIGRFGFGPGLKRKLLLLEGALDKADSRQS